MEKSTFASDTLTGTTASRTIVEDALGALQCSPGMATAGTTNGACTDHALCAKCEGSRHL